MSLFFDRKEAGQRLALALKEKIALENALVLALPRGGIVVGAEVARVLNLPFDFWVVRKIGYPTNPEYAIGALGEGGTVVLSEETGYPGMEDYLKEAIPKEKEEISRRVAQYRGNQKRVSLWGKTVVLVDDGLATGLTMKVAAREVKKEKPGRVVVAVPVASSLAVKELQKEADQIIALDIPEPFFAVGDFYTHFEQVTDEEVKEILAKLSLSILKETKNHKSQNRKTVRF